MDTKRIHSKNKVKELEVVFIPKELWSKCTKNTIRDILRWDNANRKKITSKDTDQDEIIDAIGDIVVVLTNLAYLRGVNIETCVATAYDVISKRTGKMINGTFVKDE